MQIFKNHLYVEHILKTLIFINIIVITFAFFSPSLPKITVSILPAIKWLLPLLCLLVILYALLKKEVLKEVLHSQNFVSGMLIYIGILFFLILIQLPYIIHHQSFLNADKSITLLMVKNISAGDSFPIYFYGQLYQGTLNTYIYSLIYKLIPCLKISVLLGNTIFFSLFIFVGSLLINKITNTSSFFYPIVILFLPVSRILFFLRDEIRGFSLIIFLLTTLFYCVFKFTFQRKKHLFIIGLISGILFWVYQPALGIIIGMFIWIFITFLYQRNYHIILKSFLLLLAGFFMGNLPHILAEINNGFVNTKFLFSFTKVLSNIGFLSKISLSKIIEITTMSLDARKIISYFLFLLFISGVIILLYRGLKERDMKRLYLIIFFLFVLFLLSFSRYLPTPRYINHFKLYSFLSILIIIAGFKEIKVLGKRGIKIAFFLLFIGFFILRTVNSYPIIKRSHIKNINDISQIQKIKENIILGNYWNAMRFSPFLSDKKMMITGPNLIRPEGIFTFSKYYLYAFKLGEMWEKENKAFIISRRMENKIDEFLNIFDMTFVKKKLYSKRFIIYSDFSKILSPYLYSLLISKSPNRYVLTKKNNYLYFRDILSSIPEPVINENRITFYSPNNKKLSSQGQKKYVTKNWRYTLDEGENVISFPVNLLKNEVTYLLPKSTIFKMGKYKKRICFMNMPVFEFGDVVLKNHNQNKLLSISEITDRLSFYTIHEKKRGMKSGLSINGLKLTIMDEEVVSVELHVYSLFGFGSTIWTNQYKQILYINKKSLPLAQGQNKIVYQVRNKNIINLDTEFKTLLVAMDSKKNFVFKNTGAILEKIVVHKKDFSQNIVPFLRVQR